MRFFSYIRDARKTIMANKMRSGLSTLGIVIGMMSVIVMMAIGQGTEAQIMKNMGDLMKNKFSVIARGGYNQWDEEKQAPGQYIKGVAFTKEIIPYIEGYFPLLSGRITYEVEMDGGEVKIKNKSDYISARGVPQNWFNLNEKELLEWSFLEAVHYERMSFVAVVNNHFKETFYPNTSPIGKKVKVWNKEYSIVGVLKKEDFERGGQLYIPDTTTMERIKHNNKISGFEVFLEPGDDNQLWQDRVMYLLLKKFNFPNKGSSGIDIHSSAKFAQQFQDSTNMFKYLLLGIGAISLLVWGIGIMNIMIVSVTERTREIWIRKAIWALNSDIVIQFLVESVVVTFIGGVIAFLLSHWVVAVLNKFLFGGGMEGGSDMQAMIDLKVVVVAFSLTALTGILFGILPARKAAQLRPIDALRFE